MRRRRSVCLVMLALLSGVAFGAPGEDLPSVPDHGAPWLLALRPGGWEPLRNGDRVRPGDKLMWRCAVKETVWVYVLNYDATGAAFVLFPLPDQGATNPLVPGSHTLPSESLRWVVDTAGGEEFVAAIICRRRCADVEAEIRSIPRAQPSSSGLAVDGPPLSHPPPPATLLRGPPGGANRLMLRIRLLNPAPTPEPKD